jgi:hypothetical protein
MPGCQHPCLKLASHQGGTAELEDCVLENMEGSGNIEVRWIPCSASSSCTLRLEAIGGTDLSVLHALQVDDGKPSLTRCTLRKCAASLPGHMACDRRGAVWLTGPAAVTMQHCMWRWVCCLWRHASLPVCILQYQ